jgi:hypothetical protein
MLASVSVEGIVTREQWTYDHDRLFRLAHYREADRNPIYIHSASDSKQRQKADYFTVRMLNDRIPVQAPPAGSRIVVQGYLVERQHNATLKEFNHRARGSEKLPDDVLAVFGDDLTESRSVVEIVAERIHVLSEQRPH